MQKRKNRDQALATLDKVAREYPKSPEARRGAVPEGPAPRGRRTVRGCAGGVPEDRRRLCRPGRSRRRALASRMARVAPRRTRRGGGDVVADQRHARRRRPIARPRATGSARADEIRGDSESAARRYAQIRADAPRSYYGILAAAAKRPRGAPRAKPAFHCLAARRSARGSPGRRRLRAHRSPARRRARALRRRGDGRSRPPRPQRSQAALRGVGGLCPGRPLSPGSSHHAPPFPVGRAGRGRQHAARLLGDLLPDRLARAR